MIRRSDKSGQGRSKPSQDAALTPARAPESVALSGDASGQRATGDGAGNVVDAPATDARSVDHVHQLQEALEESAALTEKILARSRTLLQERDEARAEAASELARMTDESQELSLLTETKVAAIEEQLAAQQSEYAILVDLIRQQKALSDVHASAAKLEISELNEELGEVRSALGQAKRQILERAKYARDLKNRLNSQTAELGYISQTIAEFVGRKPSLWERIGTSLHVYRRSDSLDSIVDRSEAKTPPPSPSSVHRQATGHQQMTEFSQAVGRNPFLRASSIDELLSWDDVDFIRCAYVTILGRQPDLPGQAHYVEQLRNGMSKRDLLWRLRRSPEGKSHDPGIAGLDRTLKRAALQRRPLLGVFSRFVRADADGNGRKDRVLRSLLNASAVNQDHLRAIGERLSAIPAVADQSPAHLATVAVHADHLVRPGYNRAGELVDGARTPELDHLRTGRAMNVSLGHSLP